MSIEGGHTRRSKAEKEAIEHRLVSVSASLRERFVAVIAPISSSAEITERQDIGGCLEQRTRLRDRAAAGVTPKIEKTHPEGEHRKCKRRSAHANHCRLGYDRVKGSRPTVWAIENR